MRQLGANARMTGTSNLSAFKRSVAVRIALFEEISKIVWKAAVSTVKLSKIHTKFVRS